MNETKKLSVHMTRGETLAGWIYLPFYVVLLSLILVLVFDFLGLDYLSKNGQTNLNGVFFIINFVVCLVIFHRFLFHNLLQIGKRFWGFVQAVILGFVMYFVGMALVSGALNYLLPGLQNMNDAEILSMARENREIMIIGTVALAPLTEECMFRGLIFQSIHKKNRILAYAVSTLIFSAIHVVGYIGQTVSPVMLLGSFVQYIPASIALAWTYEKADSIFASMTMHCLINAIAMRVMLL